MKRRIPFALGILTGLALIFGVVRVPRAPFAAEAVACYQREGPPGTVATVVSELEKVRTEQQQIDHGIKAMEPHVAAAANALTLCTPQSCVPDAAKAFVRAVKPYLAQRQSLTTRFYARHGEAAPELTRYLFSTPEELQLKARLKDLAQSKTIDLRDFGGQRWMAAMLAFKTDEQIRPCDYQRL